MERLDDPTAVRARTDALLDEVGLQKTATVIQDVLALTAAVGVTFTGVASTLVALETECFGGRAPPAPAPAPSPEPPLDLAQVPGAPTADADEVVCLSRVPAPAPAAEAAEDDDVVCLSPDVARSTVAPADVIDLSTDDDDVLAHKMQRELNDFIVIDSDDEDDEDDIEFVRSTPGHRRQRSDDIEFVRSTPGHRRQHSDDIEFVRSTPAPKRQHTSGGVAFVDVDADEAFARELHARWATPKPAAVDADADEALARKLHARWNGDAEAPTRASPAKRKRSPQGPFEGRDVLAKQRRDLFKFLQSKAKALRIVDVEMNPAAEPGKRLYERFMAAWAWSASKKMKLVFHGTPQQNVAAILENGLDPNRRGASSGQRLGQGEYFGARADVSTEYCGGGRTLIVFVVLLEPRATRDAGQIVVSSDVNNQLPLATISFANPTPARPTHRALKITDQAERTLARRQG